MRKILALLVLWLCAASLQPVDAQIRQMAEIMPQFDGGVNELKRWLSTNMMYPAEAIQKKEAGRVIVSFVITEDGSISNPKVIKSVSDLLDTEALRLVSHMPKWKPANHEGRPCSVEYTLPINFTLPNSNTITAGSKTTEETAEHHDSDSDEWKQLTGHSTYEGAFEEFGYDKQTGKAKYQYIDKGASGRVFDGKFEFYGDEHLARNFVVKGQFSNDIQVGRWTFSDDTHTVIINYDEQGRLHGEFSICSFNHRNSMYLFGGQKFEGEVEHGVFKRIRYGNYYEVTYWGGGNGDIDDIKMLTQQYGEWDERNGWWYKIDHSTGDKVLVRTPEGFLRPKEVLRSCSSLFWNYRLRRTMSGPKAY